MSKSKAKRQQAPSNGSGGPDVRVPNPQVQKEQGVSYQTLRRWEARTRKHIEQYGHALEGDYPLPDWVNGRKYQWRSKLDVFNAYSGSPVKKGWPR
jgi:hypothetical protein